MSRPLKLDKKVPAAFAGSLCGFDVNFLAFACKPVVLCNFYSLHTQAMVCVASFQGTGSGDAVEIETIR